MNLFLHFYACPNEKSGRFYRSLKNGLALSLFLGLFLFAGISNTFAESTTTSYDTCDDVTNGGTVAGDETGCNDPVFDPSIIVSTSPATGGSNELEYLWMSTTDDPNGTAAIWNIIAGSSGQTLDPGPITETTYYRRCARRVGCSLWIQESNTVVKEVECAAECDLDIRNIVGVNPMCNPGNSGIIALSIVGGTAPYTYSWSNGDTTEDITDLSEGEYCVTVTDANGCVVSDCVTLDAPDPLTETVVLIDATCGEQNGSIDLSVSGGTAPYTYTWNNNTATQDLSNLGAGTYCVDIEDSKGCLINACYIINESNNNTVSITPSNSTVCPGESVTLTANGSGTYTWSATAGNLSNTNGQSTTYTMGMPGTYTITVQATDANGCVASGSATVTVNAAPNVGGNASNATCGENNGAITTSVSGGAMPYTYAWSNSQTTANISNLGAGQYCVTVTDANGCTNSNCYNVGESGANNVNITPSNTNVCPGESVTLTANGTGTYSWSATAGNLSNTNGQSTTYTMGMPGTYTITVQATDANGCVAFGSATVTVNAAPNVGGNASNATCGENNGAVSTSVSGGAMPYTYAWSNSQTTANISNLGAGEYCVTVTDANGCTNSNCYNVDESGANNVNITPSNTNVCPGESVTLTANGTSTYSWSATAGNLSNTNGQSTTYTMGMPGTYTINVQATDANGCVAFGSATVTVNAAPTVGGNASNATCGESNGAISTSVSGGALPYTYAWSNSQTTANISNLDAGQYCVTVTDANGCANSNCYNVGESGASNVSITPSNITVCAGETVTLTANGSGTYAWSTTGGNLSNTNGQSISFTAGAGTYTISVEATDANGCVAYNSATITISNPPNFITNQNIVTHTTCGENNGAITSSVTGGIAPYSYSWDNGATTPNISNLAAGTYCLLITDANGCNANLCFVIEDSNSNTLNVTPNISDVCPGAIVTLTASGNGSGSGTVLWSASAGTLSSTSGSTITYTTGMAGTYNINAQLTDANGCTANGSAIVNVIAPPTIGGTPTDATCGESNGSIITNVTGGAAPYSYAWNTGATTSNLNNLVAGQYCVTVTDANGCSNSNCFTVGESGANSVSITPNNSNVCPGESVTLTANGNGSFVWSASAGNLSNTSGQSTQYTMGMPGTYTITVQATDANGCTAFNTVNVTVNTPPSFGAASINPVCSQSNDGSISTIVTGGAAPYTYMWSNNATTANLNNLSAGEYCVTITDTNNCTDTECYTVVENTLPIVTISNPGAACDVVGNLSANAVGGTFTYLWNTGETTSTISNLIVGNEYCVVVTGVNGCSTETCTTVGLNQSVALAGTVQNPTCESNNGSITNIVSNTNSLTFAWSNGATTAELQNLAAGTYTLTVTTEAGCVSTSSYTLVNEGDLDVSLDAMNPICLGASNGMVTAVTNYTGTGSLLYSWNTGATTNKISNLSEGQYCVTVTSDDGCEANACTVLTAPTAITADAIINSAGCMASNGNIKLTIFGGTAPYTFKWDNGATTQDIESVGVGTYCVTICDALGCTFTDCFTVTGGVGFAVGLNPTGIVCNGDSNGSISSDINGGTAPFTYIWNTGATSSSINNLSAGAYCVTVTDVFGCATVQCADIVNPNPITASTTATNTSCNENNGTASATSSATLATVAWSNGGSTSTITNLAAGNYTVTVTSTEGCIATSTVTVNPSSAIAASIAPMNTTICPGEELVLTGTSSLSAATDYTWLVNGGNLSATTGNSVTYTMMMPGTYTITLEVVNAQGCIDTDQATITVLEANNPICNPDPSLVNIGDYVWFDGNNNGIQDPGELGIEGIDVKLMTAGPDGIFYTADDITVLTQTTSSTGYYLFENVAAGEYVIMFCLNLPGTEYTNQNIGGNDLLDSDANPNTGKTDPFTIVAGQDDDLSFDAGIILTPTGCDNLTDGGEICCDQIICGAGTIAEHIPNITLPSGGSGAIEYLWMSSTVGGVFDINTWTPIAGAAGPDYQPGAISQTTFIARCARRVGCTTYRESNIIKLEVKAAPTATIQSLPAFICVGETDNFNATNAGVAVTYTWDLGEGASPATATGQHLTNVSWNTPGTKTITLTTTNLFCTSTHTRVVEVGSCLNQDDDRFITVAATAVPESMDVNLDWETNPEMNDYIFTVEQSMDGENFEIIYTMDGNDAFESKTYTFMDEDARPGRNYYRIKHISNNGKTVSSENVLAIIEDFQVERFIMFPNPTQDYVIFESLKLSEEEGTIMISDMKGTIIEQIVIPANTTQQMIDISNYPPGNYTFFIKYHDIRSIPTIIHKMER